jgi:hypothetical protein
MNSRTILALSTSALLSLSASIAAAQNSPPTFQADPDAYKLIFENENFRVIAATWKKGTQDKPHSHPVPSILYALTDCTLRVHAPDGTTRDITAKAGVAMAVPIIPSHTAENISPTDCQAVFVERK